MKIKPLKPYPNHPEFEELLNSCASMTYQLEALGHKLTVTLIQEGVNKNSFSRFIFLNLNQKPVIAAYSSCQLKDQYFVKLLQNANITPIGKFLFAPYSEVKREDNMQISFIKLEDISQQIIQTNLLQQNYQPQQQLWLRSSVFSYQNEKLYLDEFILPELDSFF